MIAATENQITNGNTVSLPMEDGVTRLVRQLVTDGCRLAPTFRAEFNRLATDCGLTSHSDESTPLNLRVLDELIVFCHSLNGRAALERLWELMHEPPTIEEEFGAVAHEERIA